MWPDNIEKIRDAIGTVGRVRLQNTTMTHVALAERINQLANFRREHEEMRHVLMQVLMAGADTGSDTQQALQDAYDMVAAADVLDLSRPLAALQQYQDQVMGVEERIATVLRDRLEVVCNRGNSTEIFREFSRYNALFSRPRVRAVALLICLIAG